MEKQNDNSNPETPTKLTGSSSDESNNILYSHKIVEQILFINKISVGAFIFIISLLIVLLFFQGRTLNNDSYNKNIEYFINECGKNSQGNDEIKELLKELIEIQKIDTTRSDEDK